MWVLVLIHIINKRDISFIRCIWLMSSKNYWWMSNWKLVVLEALNKSPHLNRWLLKENNRDKPSSWNGIASMLNGRTRCSRRKKSWVCWNNCWLWTQGMFSECPISLTLFFSGFLRGFWVINNTLSVFFFNLIGALTGVIWNL